MTTKTLLRICASFEIATGVALSMVPDFVVREIFGGGSLDGDIAMARGAGFGVLLLGLICWPIGDDVDTRLLWAQLAYNVLTALYLGYLKQEGGFTSTLLWPTCALHGLIAIMLIGLIYERFSTVKSGRANQH
jgi:hypothetical protein